MLIGISLGSTCEGVFGSASDKGAAQYERMAALGVTNVRIDATYTSGAAIGTDAAVRAALAAGLNPLLIFDGYNNTTIGASNFLAHCQRVTTTYSALGVHAYELLNEPNSAANWNPGGSTSATGYTSLLQSVYPAVKTIDSTATLVLGSGAPYGSVGDGSMSGTLNPVTWLSDLYTAGAHGYFDAVGAHPYSWPALPGNTATWNAWQQMAATSTSLYSLMTANSDSAKKIWVTEFGAPSASSSGINANPSPTSYPAGTIPFQAETISQGVALAGALSCVGAFFAFDWADSSPGDGYFGLTDPYSNPKLTLEAFEDAVLALT